MSREQRGPTRAQQIRLEACPWILKVGSHRWLRTEIVLGFGRDLFSSAGVDVGTLRLLRVIERAPPLRFIGDEHPVGQAPLRVLDLGCGVGSIGLSIAAAYPPGSVHVTLADRDALATYVTTLNAQANGLQDRADAPVTVLPAGLDFEPARAARCAPFDFIVTNVPAKIGRAGLERFLFGAGSLLKPGGYVATVHVTPLTDTVDEMLAAFGEQGGEVEVVYGSRGAEHFARVWRFEHGLPEPDRSDPIAPYLRDDVDPRLEIGELQLRDHRAAHDVAEFDTAHFHTPLLVERLEKDHPAAELIDRERILVVNPAHGFLAELLAQDREPAAIALIGRDALEVAIARRNLAAFLASEKLERTSIEDVTASSAMPWLPAPVEATGRGFTRIIGGFQWKEGQEALAITLKAYAAALADDLEASITLAVGAGQAQALRRIARENGLQAVRESTRKGYSAVSIRRRSATDSAESPDAATDEAADEAAGNVSDE